MSAQPPATSAEDVETTQSQEEAKQTYDEKLANLYTDLSSQNQFAIQLIIGSAVAGIGYSREVIQAYNFLKKPLDPEKLMTDPKYKAWVERATKLVQRHEGQRKLESGKSKYSEIIPKTQTALERVEATHSHLRSDKSVLLTNRSAYLAHIQTVYGFDEKQIKALASGAWERIKERPTLSMHEALRIEAESLSIKQIKQEVDKDSRGKGLTEKQKKTEVQKRLAERRGKFETAAEKWIHWEEGKGKPVIDQGIRQIADTLGVKLEPTTTPAASIAPQPLPTQAPPPTSPQPAAPTAYVSVPGTSSIKGKVVAFLQRSAALQTVRFAMRQVIAASLIRLRKAGFRSLAKLGLALSKKAFPFLFRAGATAIGAAASLGATLAIQVGLELLKKLPVVGGIVEGGEKIVWEGVKLAVVLLLVIVIGIPIVFVFLIGSSSNTIPNFGSGENAMIVSLPKEGNLSWYEFEKRHLTLDFSDWYQFESNNLFPNLKYLSDIKK